MRIGELAQTCSVSRDTLRFYEDRGLIRAQRSANSRPRPEPAPVIMMRFCMVKNLRQRVDGRSLVSTTVHHSFHQATEYRRQTTGFMPKVVPSQSKATPASATMGSDHCRVMPIHP